MAAETLALFGVTAIATAPIPLHRAVENFYTSENKACSAWTDREYRFDTAFSHFTDHG